MITGGLSLYSHNSRRGCCCRNRGLCPVQWRWVVYVCWATWCASGFVDHPVWQAIDDACKVFRVAESCIVSVWKWMVLQMKRVGISPAFTKVLYMSMSPLWIARGWQNSRPYRNHETKTRSDNRCHRTTQVLMGRIIQKPLNCCKTVGVKETETFLRISRNCSECVREVVRE